MGSFSTVNTVRRATWEMETLHGIDIDIEIGIDMAAPDVYMTCFRTREQSRG